MTKVKNSVIALLIVAGLTAVPSVAKAEESMTVKKNCTYYTSGSYGQVTENCDYEESKSTWSRVNISYVESVSQAVIYNTALTTQAKVALSSIMVAGVIGLLIKMTKFAK